MGFFDFLRPKSAPLSDDALRSLLLTTMSSGGVPAVRKLISQHRDQLVQCAVAWKQVPADVRSAPTAMNNYAQTLICVATTLNELGHSALLTALTERSDNPITSWQKTLSTAQGLLDTMRFPEGIELLNNCLIDNRSLQGTGADHLAALTHGMLGHFCYSAGQVETAAGHYQRTLDSCRKTDDTQGAEIYLKLLYETHRYLGRNEQAADFAEQAARSVSARGDNVQTRDLLRRAKITRAGAPLNRIILLLGHETFELDDPALNSTPRQGAVKALFERNRPSLPSWEKYSSQAAASVQANRQDEAIQIIREAADADPFEPDCHYKWGHLLLQQGRYADALEHLREAEHLAPGWFNCRADIWLAEQLVMGSLGQEEFLALWFLEDGPAAPLEKIRLAEQAREKLAAIPLFHLLLGQNYLLAQQPDKAIASFRVGIALQPEPDVRSHLLLALASIEPDPPQKSRLFDEIRAITGGNLNAMAMAVILSKVGRKT